MPDSQVTIVVVPRERFSFARRALESLYGSTTPSFRLVYVDAGSPRRVARDLAAQARERGFRLIRSDAYLTPNRARNLGLREADTPYVVFLDNDVLVTPGWLDALVRCADETGASVAGPLYLLGEPERRVIHGIGRATHIEEREGRRFLYTRDDFKRQRLEDLPAPLERGPCELVEFHCMLVRVEIFRRLGPLDEGLLSLREQHDLCLAVQAAGGSIVFEPASVVAYVAPERLAWSDLPFFMVRWSEARNRASLRHFFRKWALDMRDGAFEQALARATGHRQRLLKPLRDAASLAGGDRFGRVLERRVLAPLERAFNRAAAPLIDRARGNGVPSRTAGGVHVPGR